MEFHSGLNLLLEALAYLGRRAGGFTTERMLERLRERGVEDVSPIEASLCPIARLTGKLDRVLDPDPERLQYLFGNLPGFPYNTIGSYSRGFLLLYGVISRFRGSCAEVLDQAVSRTAAQLAGDLSMELDLGEEPELTGEELSLRVLSMNVPAESKVAVLELYHSGPALLGEVMGMVQAVVDAMEREKAAMEVCCAPFVRLVRELGPGAVLAKTSSLNTDPDRSDIVRPFLYGMDTLLAVTLTKDHFFYFVVDAKGTPKVIYADKTGKIIAPADVELTANAQWMSLSGMVPMSDDYTVNNGAVTVDNGAELAHLMEQVKANKETVKTVTLSGNVDLQGAAVDFGTVTDNVTITGAAGTVLSGLRADDNAFAPSTGEFAGHNYGYGLFGDIEAGAKVTIENITILTNGTKVK